MAGFSAPQSVVRAGDGIGSRIHPLVEFGIGLSDPAENSSGRGTGKRKLMRAFCLPVPSEGLASRWTAGAVETMLRPLQALIAAPTLLFLAALTAMLFCHPEVPLHQLNRVVFGILVLGVVARAVVLREPLFRFERASWLMIALTLMVLASMIGRPFDEDALGLLATKYLIPFTLFHLAATVFTEEKGFLRFEIFMLVVLTYLSFTSIAFIMGAHALVFPKFILDPSLGHHADRARGPFLQAVANGVSLNILGLLAWHGYRRGTLRGRKTLLLLGSLPIAILATMTRAVWLSFAGSLIAVLFISKNLKARVACVAVMVLAAASLCVVMSTSGFGGALSDRMQESAPVDYRKAVYAGGWQMFLERPIAGWGFHQMPAELPKYVSEYKDKVLYPHNTYLEVLVENGLIGLAFYLWLMWEMLRLGRVKVPRRESNGFLDREFHQFWPILLAVYWLNGAVVVMSYQFVNGILFTLAGMLAAQRRRAAIEASC